MSDSVVIAPSRRLSAKERKIFDRVLSEFSHLVPSDAEQLTQYSEAAIRYQVAAKEIKQNPTVEIAVVNRASGNITGFKIVRNPAFVTLREASAQMVSLGRRLMIDAHSAEKRMRMQSKKARSQSSVEADAITERDLRASLTQEQIEAAMTSNRKGGYLPFWCKTVEMEREFALYWLIEDALLGPDDDPNDNGH
jgi:phage terminase small subunit